MHDTEGISYKGGYQKLKRSFGETPTWESVSWSEMPATTSLLRAYHGFQ